VNGNLVAKQVTIHLTPDAAKYILDKTCGDRSYGARPLRRALQKYIEDPLSEALIQGSLPRPSNLEVFCGVTGIYYRRAPVEGEAPQTEALKTETPAPETTGTEIPVTAGGAPAEAAPATLLYTFE
jgi:ATP-dependent Clp protease ATP-binding subunit ClpC